jgi:hypothetical protein
MNVAGGSAHDSDRWPGYALAIPRGPREQLWHIALAVSLVVALAVPALRVLTPLWALAALSARYLAGWFIPPWLLRRVALIPASVSIIFLAGSLGADDLLALAWAIVRDDTSGLVEDLPLPQQVALLGFLYGAAGLVVSTVVGYDLRSVRRDVADQRVWERQQLRRRQVMAQHHRRNPPPEAR